MFTVLSWLVEAFSVVPVPWLLPGTLLTPTTTVTSTVTAVPTNVSPTVIPPTATPAPLPPPWESGTWLVDTDWVMLYHTPLLVVFAVLGVAALVLYFYFSRRRYAGHMLHAHLTEFLAGILGAASVVGLLLLLCAYFMVPFLSMPVWPLILIVALLAFAGFVIWYYLQRYPARLAAYERDAVKQRYMPTARERTKKTTPSKPSKLSPSSQRRRKKKRKRR